MTTLCGAKSKTRLSKIDPLDEFNNFQFLYCLLKYMTKYIILKLPLNFNIELFKD